MEKSLMRNLLYDVLENGTATISKQRLLWWMGRSNDTPTAWQILLEEWEEVGGDRADLQGFETHSGWLTLFIGEAEPVVNWSKSDT